MRAKFSKFALSLSLLAAIPLLQGCEQTVGNPVPNAWMPVAIIFGTSGSSTGSQTGNAGTGVVPGGQNLPGGNGGGSPLLGGSGGAVAY
jgi:hypothetical protein